MSTKSKTNNNSPITIENRKARHDYFIEETIECGIELLGNEVKSIRAGKVSLKESWVDIKDGQLIIKQMHIAKYETASWQSAFSIDFKETRDRRLLAHKNEIRKLSQSIQVDGYTIIPLKMYIHNGKVKVLIGLAKGKHNYDKRNSLKDKQIKRDIDRIIKSR